MKRHTFIEANVDGIKHEVAYIHNGNLIPNLNGQDGYFGWSGKSGLIVSDELEVQEFMTAGLPAVIKDIEGSEVPSGWQFRNSGELLSPFGYVIPNEFDYSFRGKVGNFKPFTIKLYEYKGASDNKELINTQTFDMAGNVQYQQFTTTLKEETRHVQLGFNV